MRAKKSRTADAAPGVRRRWLIAPGIVVALAAVGAAADWWICLPPGATATYVGRQTCAQCHALQASQWTDSDHDLAMQPATAETVLGDFNGAELTHHGVTTRMFRRGDDFYVHTEGPTGEMEDFPVKYTFGVRPLQQYMVEFPDGRVQVLRVSWDTAKKRWFYVPPPDVSDRILPGDPLHWTGTAQNWNHMCADCHSTNVHKNFDLASRTYHTTYSEIDVSCEACHGPGSLHVELARSKSLFWDRKRGYALARLKDASSKTEVETCAKCHARRNIVHEDFTPGDELLDSYEPALLHAGLYHADGQILDEVYEYGSFVQSKMYHKNVRCSDCHNPHTTKVKFAGNQLCGQCHQPGKYDGPVHHHHKAGSKGASCVECHMPSRPYMVVDPRRDHSLRVPRPDLTVSLGIPNACNDCHTKPHETAAWAAQQVASWFGPKRTGDPHYAPALAAARAGKPDGEKLLLQCLRRPQTPAIVRATIMELLGQYGSSESQKAQAKGTHDESPLVRAAAARSLMPASLGSAKEQLLPLVSDPVRAVRIAAARRLAGPLADQLAAPKYAALNAALEEYRQAQLASSDRAGAHLNLGNLDQDLGRTHEAMEEFRTAIRLEPYLSGPRSNLAMLLEQAGDHEAEVAQLRKDETERLARDASLLPENADVQHRYGLALYLSGRPDDAEAPLAASCRLDPANYQYRLILTLLYEKLAKWDDALASARHLCEIRPDDPVAAQLEQKYRAIVGAQRNESAK